MDRERSTVEILFPRVSFIFVYPFFFTNHWSNHEKETLRKESRYVLLKGNYSNSSLNRSKELFFLYFVIFFFLNNRMKEWCLFEGWVDIYRILIRKEIVFHRSLYFSRYLRTSWNTFTSIQGLRRRVVTRMTYIKGGGDVINLLVWHFGWFRGKACQKPEHNIPLKLDA